MEKIWYTYIKNGGADYVKHKSQKYVYRTI